MAQTIYSSNTNGNLIVATYRKEAAAALGERTFFTAPFACIIQSISFRYGTAAGATSTVTVTKDGAAAGPGTGTAVLTAAVDMNTTTNTSVFPALAASAATITLALGDTLSTHVATGTATGSADILIQVNLARV